jgi:hypothetical protein
MAARQVQAITDKLNIIIFSVKNWMEKLLPVNENRTPRTAKCPRDRGHEQRSDALHNSHGLLGEASQARCRKHSLFYHQLAQRQADFCRSGGASLSREEAQALPILKAENENQRLEHTLERKERVLAEAAALPVSQKNYRALLRSKAE